MAPFAISCRSGEGSCPSGWVGVGTEEWATECDALAIAEPLIGPSLRAGWRSGGDDHEATAALDNSLRLRLLMARENKKVVFVRRDPLVLRGGDLEFLRAARVAALADEQAHPAHVPLAA